MFGEDKDHPIPHPAQLAAELAVIKARARKITAQSLELLRSAEPDTFLGKQHYPLLPLPHEEQKPRSEASDEGT
jgi:hypothetical protein